MKDFVKVTGLIAIIALLMFGSMYFRWWRCGEMFPHAQFACFVGGR